MMTANRDKDDLMVVWGLDPRCGFKKKKTKFKNVV